MQSTGFIVRAGILVAGMALTISCTSSTSGYSMKPSVDPVSVVEINRDFVIPINRARVYIQDGVPATLGNIDRRSTYCSLLMQDLHVSGEPRLTISPGRFNITKVLQFNDLYYLRRVFVASESWFYDPPDNVMFQVEMRLSSEQQPDVRALICAINGDYRVRHYPTLAEIKVALGDAIVIDTPQ